MSQRSDTRAIGLEGMVSTLTVLKVGSDDLAIVERALRTKVEQLPNFFHDGPVIIDLAAVEGSVDDPDAPPLCALSLADLVRVLRELSLVPIGVRNPRAARMPEVEALGLAPMRARGARAAKARVAAPEAGGAHADVEPARAAEAAPSDGGLDDDESPSAEADGSRRPAVTLRSPVRGGQVVYAEGTDAIAMAAVNSGGELIADGNVHVYGPLRGRAVAGVHGDESARIFCLSLEAELVSIAGVYLGADDLPDSHRGKPAKISLRNDSLVVEDLS